MTQERRKYPRRKPPPEYALLVSTAEMEQRAGQRHNLAIKLVDISPKGALIVTAGRLREGVHLHVEIHNARTDAHFRGKGTIRWSQTWTHESREANVAGLEFTEVTEVRGLEMEYFSSWAKVSSGSGADALREHARGTPPDGVASCFAGGMLGYSSKNIARRLVDLSEEGAQLDLMEKLDAGKKVRIRLKFKSSSADMEAEGEVRWCKRNTMVLEPHWLTGVKFTRVSEEDRLKIRTVAVMYLAQRGATSIEDGPPVNLV